MPPKRKNRKSELEWLRQAARTLLKISKLGDGIRPDQIDWGNIGKIAKAEAKAVIAQKCPTCKRPVQT